MTRADRRGRDVRGGRGLPWQWWLARTGLAAAAVAIAAGVVLAWRYGSAADLALALAAPAIDSWLAPAHDAPSRAVINVPAADGRALRADLYRPTRESGALLLVHGLSPAGRHHPELARLAWTLARRGQLVLVPHFEGLAAFRLEGREVDDVRASLAHLRALTSRPVGVAGFSFGAGPALLAAAEFPDLRLAGAFGGYADLRHVIAFITTGTYRFGDQRGALPQEEYNRWKLLALLAGFAEKADARARLEAIARRRLANPGDDTRGQEAELDGEGAAILALVVNRRDDALPALLAALPAGARRAMDALSPLPAMPRLAGRLLVAHGAGDQSIPYTESLRLAAAAGPHERAIILETFHHVGPRPWWPSAARLRDGGRLVRIADRLLSP